MRAAAVLLAAAVALAVAGCGAGAPVDQRRALGSVHALEISGGVNVQVVRGAVPSATVHAGRAVVDRVETEARDGVLRISVRHGIVIGADPLDDARVRVTLPRLDAVQISHSNGVDLSGIDTGSLDLRVSGAGDVTARGRVGHLDAHISGVGQARLAGLRARSADVTVNGAGDVDLDVSDRLDIAVHGVGKVTYRGHPRVSQDISGAAKVERVP